jgi:ATP-binding cassette subfamily C protein
MTFFISQPQRITQVLKHRLSRDSLRQAITNLRQLPAYLRERFKRPDLRRTPTLLQMEAVECGAASLGMILGYHGRIVSLAELRQSCGISRDGSKASNLLNAAKLYHLQGKGFKANLESLQSLERPYIVFWNFNHFLVVEGFHRQWVYLNDPATGPRRVSLAEFSEAFTGVVLTFKPDKAFEPGGQGRNLLRSLRQRLQGSVRALAFCLLAGLLLVLPGLAMPAFSQVFIDQVLIQGRDNWLRPLILAITITAILTGLLTRLQLQILRRLRIKLAMGMSSGFLWHILHLPVSFYDQRFAGEISNRIKLNDRLAGLLSGELATTAISCVMVVFYGIVMALYDPVLTLIAIVSVGVNILALRWVSRIRSDTNTRLMQEQGKVSGVAIAGLQSIETLKASGLESDFFNRWAGYYAKSLNARQDMDSLNQRLSTLPAFLAGLNSMLLLTIGGFRVIDGALSIGMLVAFQSLIQQFMQPVNQVLRLAGDFQELGGTLDRLDDVLQNPIDPLLPQAQNPGSTHSPNSDSHDCDNDCPPGRQSQHDHDSNHDHNHSRQGRTPYAPTHPSTHLPPIYPSTHPPIHAPTHPRTHAPTHPKLQGHLEIRNLTFGYNRSAPPLIENFNLSLKPGQRVALVGGSGSGKSTVAKLVCGLYQPWSGDIYFDGYPRPQIPRPILVNSLAMIEQDVLLFAGSVRDNLTLWDTTIPEASLIQACRDAAIQDVVLSMAGGYNAELLEGAANLSGGQRQRLEIARALVNNPSILVMDEATSALDTETERTIDYNLRLRGCTCLIVAHRLSTIRDCDEIIVMHYGKVVQRGSHEQLREEEGPYLELIRSEGGSLE